MAADIHFLVGRRHAAREDDRCDEATAQGVNFALHGNQSTTIQTTPASPRSMYRELVALRREVRAHLRATCLIR